MTSTANALQRAWWLKTLHKWHWISAAISLIGLLLFSITGITLNHAASIEAAPRVAMRDARLPQPLADQLTAEAKAAAGARTPPALPNDVARWIAGELSVDTRGRELEWSADEVYIALPRPGGDAWLRIALPEGEVEYEVTTRGWVSYLNDLHKGRHTGTAWTWFIDLFAAACLLFALTGLLILKLHAANRAATWPLVAAGLLLPLVIALFTIH
ncbi:MAG: PepSY-associated TM helix domain-containing protein [Steroidobacteraceae bacterium]